MKKGFFVGLILLMALLLAAPAQSAILVDDWVIDLSAVPVQGLVGVVGFTGPQPTIPPIGIQQIIYTGVSHNQTVVDAGAPGPSVGDIAIFDGHFSAASFKFNTGVQGPGSAGGGLGIGYEFTFRVTDVAQVYAVDPVSGTNSFQHIVAGTYGGETTDNFLEIWVDNLGDALGTQSNFGTGDGFRDGTMVARLINPPDGGSLFGNPTAEGGGTFTPLTLDGADDATFKLNKVICPTCFMLTGVFWGDTDGDGILEDLSLYDGILNPKMTSAIFADNNFDADDDNDGNLDTPSPTNWGAYFPATRLGVAPPNAFYASNDGSAAAFVQVPEPSTLFLLGIGLLGFGFYGRKKIRK